jgi:hypothetical protein
MMSILQIFESENNKGGSNIAPGAAAFITKRARAGGRDNRRTMSSNSTTKSSFERLLQRIKAER